MFPGKPQQQDQTTPPLTRRDRARDYPRHKADFGRLGIVNRLPGIGLRLAVSPFDPQVTLGAQHRSDVSRPVGAQPHRVTQIR
jgi:hypothetical protein